LADDEMEGQLGGHGSGCLPAVPPLKRWKLDISVLTQQKQDREQWLAKMVDVLEATNKLIKSKKKQWDGGMESVIVLRRSQHI
jgi:hypothetical protein